MKKQTLAIAITSIFLAACGGGGSTVDGSQEQTNERRVQQHVFKYDVHYRTNFNSLAKSKGCPTENYEVWLVAGQSNAAAHAQHPTVPQEGGTVIQYHKGKCYNVAHPLLGSSASNDFGISTPDTVTAYPPHQATSYNPFHAVANAYSVQTGKTVVIMTFSIGGRSIGKWYNGDYHADFMNEASQLQSSLGISRFLWQQGESDNFEGTSSVAYVDMFEGIVDNLRYRGFTGSVHVARSSTCEATNINNQIGDAHDYLRTKYPGPNTDVLLDSVNRFDECHFSSVGVLAFKDAWMNYLK